MMSMLSAQGDELRKMAAAMSERGSAIGLDYGMGRGFVDAARMMREAADTIESLQGEVNHWRVEQINAYSNWEDAYSRVKELEADNGTRWHELFGTPERAARTIGHVCRFTHGGEVCDRCQAYLFDSCDRTLRLGSEQKIYDALLEWLRGDE